MAKINVLALAMMLVLQSCEPGNIDPPINPTPPTEPILTTISVTVQDGVLNSTNNQIETATVVAFKGSSVAEVYTFGREPRGWQLANDNWKADDSLVIFANLTKPEIAKIEV